MKKQRSKKSRWIKIIVTFIVIASIGGLVALNQANANTARQNIIPQTFLLQRTDMVRTISTSGVVQSSETTNIFSMQNSPVQEIFVEVGDRVRKGDVLARLDMSRLERDIEQAELNLTSAQTSAAEEARTNASTITNAQTSLEASRIALARQQLNTANVERDLREAEENMGESFDSSFHDRVIEDARLNVERRTIDVNNAQQDLREVFDDFDDFIFVNAITEARIALERRITALEDAKLDLEEERSNRPDAFDDHILQNAISDAERALERAREDERAAFTNLSQANWTLELVLWNPYATTSEIASAWNSVHTAQAQINNSERIIENAELNLERARTNLTRARNDHNRLTNEGRDNILSAMETAVDHAQNAVYDAQRAYHRANIDLERGKQNALEHAENHLTRMRDNLSDAIRTYERALRDKERAIEDFIDLNTTRLENAQRLFSDSQIQLENAQNSLRSAQNSLEQAQGRPVTAGTNVEIQQINIERLNNQLEEGFIFATADGVITQINARVGAAPSGTLFIIEDVDNLYVSANVREHSLVDLHLGQRGYVTTVATGNREFDADLSFISPRAVSPAGSTSVEFEIRAAINGVDNDVRIGMNAFLNVITDTRSNVFSVPLSAIVTNEHGSFVYAFENDERREVVVVTGLRTSTHAEIFGDELHENMQILARPLDTRGR